MKVIVEKRDFIEFDELERGDCFIYAEGNEKHHFIKIETVNFNGNVANAVTLEAGRPTYICSDVECIKFSEVKLLK